MHRYKVNFTPEANEDLLDIYTYIYRDLGNPVSAEKIIAKICKKCEDLMHFPKQGAVKIIFGNEQTRVVHSGKYTIIYYVEEGTKTVHIRAIKYSRIDFEKLC